MHVSSANSLRPRHSRHGRWLWLITLNALLTGLSQFGAYSNPKPRSTAQQERNGARISNRPIPPSSSQRLPLLLKKISPIAECIRVMDWFRRCLPLQPTLRSFRHLFPAPSRLAMYTSTTTQMRREHMPPLSASPLPRRLQVPPLVARVVLGLH